MPGCAGETVCAVPMPIANHPPLSSHQVRQVANIGEHPAVDPLSWDVPAATQSQLALPRQSRQLTYGRFQIAEIHRAGRLIGWGGVCKLHCNVSHRRVQCKKQMADSRFSSSQLRLAIKRWLIAGLDIANEGEAQSRHLRCSTTWELVHSGPSEEECDARIRRS